MEISLIEIDKLRLSQIYLSQKKIDNILNWFDDSLRNFQPIFVRDFLSNGNLHITDGHTRAYIAWLCGIEKIPCIYDEDEIVTCEIGQIQYIEDIAWCARFGLQHISTLKNRILSENNYKELWIGRCNKMHNLKAALLEGKLSANEIDNIKYKLHLEGLFLYGISEDYSILYTENKDGQLFSLPYIT